ncbi:MAG: S8 family peptidase, partial [Roseburia sp.]|nr:S8 family peptidase [Roseburia sp.]
AGLAEVEYMEKPKRLFFAVNEGKRVSCITPLQEPIGTGVIGGVGSTLGGGTASGGGAAVSGGLSGVNVLMGVIDSGIDYAHPDFRNADGTTRILNLWNQTIPGGSVPAPRGKTSAAETGQTEYLQSPAGYFIGTEFNRDVINLALEQPSETERYAICPSRDISGHGTHVTGIAAGNGRASQGRYRGVSYESELIIVKLGRPQENGFPRTTELMQAVDYCMNKAEEYGKPVVLNLSFGNNYGGHSGISLIETYLNDMANFGRTSIVVGSGNEGAAAVHTSGTVREGQAEIVELSVGAYETGLNLQIWKSYADDMEVAIVHPNGQSVGPIQRIQGPQRFTLGNTQILLYYGMPSPYSPFQEIYFDFIPVQDYIDSGIWEIRLIPQRIVVGNYNMWLPAGGVLNAGTGFLYPTEETTLTIPSTAAKVITVGAYDGHFDQLAAFSGRGYTRETNQIKPDIAAPGVDINSCAPGGGYVVRTGTSMATPFVSGSAGLMMEWGIVRGNDPYLYGEKIKAYLIRGARHLPVLTEYPNPQLGWGVLCLRDSLPI